MSISSVFDDFDWDEFAPFPPLTVHAAIQKACQTKNWNSLLPYLQDGLRFDDYHERSDVLNPLIKAHLENPADTELTSVLNKFLTHKNHRILACFFKCLENKVTFSPEVFSWRIASIEKSVKSTILRKVMRTALYHCCKYKESTLAEHLVQKYKLSGKNTFYHPQFLTTKETAIDCVVNAPSWPFVHLFAKSILRMESTPKVAFVKGCIWHKGSPGVPCHQHNAVVQLVKSLPEEPRAFLRLGAIFEDSTFSSKDLFLSKVFKWHAFKLGLLKENPFPDEPNKEILIAQLVTKLCYMARRFKWTGPTCSAIRSVVETIDPSFKGKDRKAFENWIQEYETKTHDYYGLDLSDDSDREEEVTYKKNSTFLDCTIEQHFEKLNAKAECARFEKWLEEFTKKPTDIKLGVIKNYFHQTERTVEPPVADFDTVRDLRTLNHHMSRGDLEEGVKSITTNFVAVQYRGIAYGAKWHTKNRRKHRVLEETNKPYYSAGVYDRAKVNFADDLTAAKEQHLHANAEIIKRKLVALRTADPKVEAGDTFRYANRAFQIQKVYSENKEKFMKFVPDLDLQTAENPFVSTGSTSLHANKYAFGIKPYKEDREDRLRPRWNKSGVAERPYSGKVYLSVHPVSDYGKEGPLDVPTLYTEGELQLDPRILNEREATFPALIEKDRVKYTFLAKYPSFAGPYNEIYLYKYGINKKIYTLLQGLFRKHAPHTPENKAVKAMLGEYLCAYHDVRLQVKAQEIVKKMAQTTGRKTVLVYRNELGGFDLARPPFVFPNNSASNPVHKTAMEAIKRARTKKQSSRSSSVEDEL